MTLLLYAPHYIISHPLFLIFLPCLPPSPLSSLSLLLPPPYVSPPSQGDDVKALLLDAMPASLPPSVAPSAKDKDVSKANVAAIGLTAAGASLLTSEYIPSSGDGSDKPVLKRRGVKGVCSYFWYM